MTQSHPFEIPASTRGLIFDCDGTLADTMPLHYQAWDETLGALGVGFPEKLFYELAGVPTVRIVEILNEQHGCGMDPVEVGDRKELRFRELQEAAQPIEPVVALAREYAGRLPMAVATGGGYDVCIRTLRALGIAELFQTIVTADDVANGKPAPDIFLEAARRLGVEPSTCLVFEDADLGLQAAAAAGMPAIDVRGALGR